MRIDYTLPEFPGNEAPYILTIGNFDGVHLGHQVLIKRVTDLARKQKKQSAVITFSNHPSTVLRPEQPVKLICTTEHKILLLEQTHIDRLFLLNFTREFAEQSSDQFLRLLQNVLPFSKIIFGSDGHIGKNRDGNQVEVIALGHELGFEAEYLPHWNLDDIPISSSRIRQSLQQGNFSEVDKLLARPYSIYAPVIRGSGRGTSIGFPTANIAVEQLCLPPLGVYAIMATYQGRTFQGVANLGVAPTMKVLAKPVLEAHFFDQNIDLYGQFIDIRFQAYIRPEKRFDSFDDLKLQIARDVVKTRALYDGIK